MDFSSLLLSLSQRRVWISVPGLPPFAWRGRYLDLAAQPLQALLGSQVPSELRRWAVATEMVGMAAEGSSTAWGVGRESSI